MTDVLTILLRHGVKGRIYSKRESSSKLIWFDLIQDGHAIQAVFNRKAYSGSDEEFEIVAKSLSRGDFVRKFARNK